MQSSTVGFSSPRSGGRKAIIYANRRAQTTTAGRTRRHRTQLRESRHSPHSTLVRPVSRARACARHRRPSHDATYPRQAATRTLLEDEERVRVRGPITPRTLQRLWRAPCGRHTHTHSPPLLHPLPRSRQYDLPRSRHKALRAAAAAAVLLAAAAAASTAAA